MTLDFFLIDKFVLDKTPKNRQSFLMRGGEDSCQIDGVSHRANKTTTFRQQSISREYGIENCQSILFGTKESFQKVPT